MSGLNAKLFSFALSAFFLWGFTAESQNESPNPAFKRIKVGGNGKGPLINIQIDPETQALALAPPTIPIDTRLIEDREQIIKSTTAKAEGAPSSVDMQEWFWADVGDRLSKGSPDRMSVAVEQLSKTPAGFFTPNADHLNTVATKYGGDILRATIGTSVSPAFVLAVIGVESAGKVDALSSAGAQGLMQLIPATAARFGVKDVMNPLQNITGGTAYLAWLLTEFKGDPLLALAAYNAGENAIKKNDGIPFYAETRAYVPKVVAAWQIARGLCTSPPELISEPCIFRSQVLGTKKQ
jgi:soluble lytic murein transglycosylase-like protein